TIANELAVSAILLTNAAQINPLGDVAVDVSTHLRSAESETVNAVASDLIVHVIADRLIVRGALGPGETSRSVANDGAHPADGDASLWISTKPGTAPTTTVSSSNWTNSILNGVAIVVHGSGPAPVISNIADQTTTVSTATPAIPFTVADADTPLNSLSLSAGSSNPSLVPNGNIVFGGAGANRTVTVTPAPNLSGVATITVTVSDGVFTASDSFVLSVSPGPSSFTNSTAISIPTSGNATPYPSTINVSALAGGTVSAVTVSLRGVTHTYPADVDVLLVGPNGQKAVIFSDVGGGGDINNVNLTFSDAAAAALTATGQISSGTYKPSNVEPGEAGELDTFSAPAPPGPYTAPLNVFIGQPANGVWSLYVVDDGPGDKGSIASWSLTIAVQPIGSQPPIISDIPNQATTVNTPTPAIGFTVNDSDTPVTSLTLSGSSSNPTLVPNGNITFGGSDANRTVTVTPASAQTGTATITVTV
ncbi:MAG TPA: proprotein convertase P-domain-containing protein, partial [Candidatus Dormibacteraeota bacterium]|nr:proprotein convertase P-domain-containing protein [Candidatus Dormibacteraeota bacterium]